MMNLLKKQEITQINWPVLVMFALGFWLSGSLLLDAVIIPGLFSAGMMTESGFAGASYLMFGTFNRIELLCAAVVLSSLLVLCHGYWVPTKHRVRILAAGCVMLGITVSYTYFLTPLMSAAGLQLDLMNPSLGLSSTMVRLHEEYWLLEVTKLLLGAFLLRWCYGANWTQVSES